MLRSSRSFGNPLFRRIHRHKNMTALFRSVDYQQPLTAVAAERELPTAPVVVATLLQEIMPESTFTEGMTGMAENVPAAQPVVQEAAARIPPTRPIVPTPSGDAASIPAPQPRTVIQPAVQRQVQPTARSIPPAVQPAAQVPSSPIQPSPVLAGKPSDVGVKDDKGDDPIWRRLQTIFRKHEEKRVQEEQQPSGIEPSSDQPAMQEKSVSGEASTPKERVVGSQRLPANFQRKFSSPPPREAPVQRQVQVEEIGTIPPPVSENRRPEMVDQQPVEKVQEVQPSASATLPFSTEMPVPPAAEKPASIEREAGELGKTQPPVVTMPPSVQDAAIPPTVQRAQEERPTDSPPETHVQQAQRQPEHLPASEKGPAMDAPTQIAAPVVQRTPAPVPQAQGVEPAPSPDSEESVAETGLGRIQPQSVTPSPRTQRIDQSTDHIDIAGIRPSRAEAEEQPHPTAMSTADLPVELQRAPASPEASPGETRPPLGDEGPRQFIEPPPYARDIIEPDEDETLIQSPLQSSPLESVWPVQIVQRSTQPAPEQSATVEPVKINPPQFLEEADGEPVYDTLKHVLPGQPTDSPLELIRPRKPRPAAEQPPVMPMPSAAPDKEPAAAPAPERAPLQTKPEVVEPIPAAQKMPAVKPVPVVQAMPAGQKDDAQPVPVVQAKPVGQQPHVQPMPVVKPEADMIPTAIGPLPSDLWTLIDQAPEAAQPVSPNVAPAASEVIPARKAETDHRVAMPVPESPSPSVQRQVIDQAPVSRAPGGMVVQLVEAPPDTGESPEQAPAEAQQAGGEVNIDELAMRVYGEVKRRLSIEWERLRRKF
jgi:hypothetical protein